MMGWVYCGNELHRRDYDAWLRLHEALDPRAREDLEDNNRFWDRYRSTTPLPKKPMPVILKR